MIPLAWDKGVYPLHNKYKQETTSDNITQDWTLSFKGTWSVETI
jgi:hypothetical protein